MTDNLLYQSIGLHISGLASLTLILILYLRSKNERTYSFKTFVSLCTLTYCVNLAQIGAFAFKYLEEVKGISSMSIGATICARLFILACVFWGATFERYYASKFLIDVNNKKHIKLLNIITTLIALVLFFGSFFFDIKYHTDSARFVLNGPFSLMTYIAFGLGILTIIVSFIKTIKNITFLKSLNLLFVLFSYILLVILEKVTNFDISEVPYILSLYTLTMYFTLENTDYVKIEKLRDEKEEAERLTEVSDKYVNDFSDKMMVSINNAFLITNLINNKEMSSDELMSNIKIVQEETNNILETINSIGDVQE